jgi:hypothetical protein
MRAPNARTRLELHRLAADAEPRINRNSDLEIRLLLPLRHPLSTSPDHVAKLLKPTPQYAEMVMRKS